MGKVISNIMAMGFIQMTNFIIPLITFPYLTRTLGLSNYGKANYALAIVLYLTSINEYGFSNLATREVSINRQDHKYLSKILCEVLSAKALLLFIIIILMSISLIIFPKLGKEPVLYLSGIIYLLGNALLPTWMFLGIERMKALTYINITSKVLTLASILLFIKQPNDYKFVIFSYGLPSLVVSIVSITLLIKEENIILKLPSLLSILTQLKRGWPFFQINISTLILNSSYLIVLGFFVSDKDLGRYSVAEKLAFLNWQLIIVISQSIYPHICLLAAQSHKLLVGFVRRIYIVFGVVFLIVCSSIFVFANDILYLVSGTYDLSAGKILTILSFHGFVVFLNMPIYQTLLAYGLQGPVSKLFNALAIVGLCCNIVLSWAFGINGAAIAVITTQILITTSLFIMLEFKFSNYSFLHRIQEKI